MNPIIDVIRWTGVVLLWLIMLLCAVGAVIAFRQRSNPDQELALSAGLMLVWALFFMTLTFILGMKLFLL